MANELPADPNPHQTEADLSAYAPRPPRIDRDRLMFEAGRAAAFSHPPADRGSPFRQGAVGCLPTPSVGVAPSQWVWPASTFVMTVVACGLGVALFLQVEPIQRVQVIERVVHAPSPSPPLPSPHEVAVSSDRMHQTDFPPQPAAPAEEAPLLTVDALPEDHLLRVRHVALTQGVDALAPRSCEATPRLSPPPTRGSLMRKIAAPQVSAATSTAWFGWPAWANGR
jgi:hypothetical protein